MSRVERNEYSVIEKNWCIVCHSDSLPHIDSVNLKKVSRSKWVKNSFSYYDKRQKDWGTFELCEVLWKTKQSLWFCIFLWVEKKIMNCRIFSETASSTKVWNNLIWFYLKMVEKVGFTPALIESIVSLQSRIMEEKFKISQYINLKNIDNFERNTEKNQWKTILCSESRLHVSSSH